MWDTQKICSCLFLAEYDFFSQPSTPQSVGLLHFHGMKKQNKQIKQKTKNKQKLTAVKAKISYFLWGWTFKYKSKNLEMLSIVIVT